MTHKGRSGKSCRLGTNQKKIETRKTQFAKLEPPETLGAGRAPSKSTMDEWCFVKRRSRTTQDAKQCAPNKEHPRLRFQQRKFPTPYPVFRGWPVKLTMQFRPTQKFKIKDASSMFKLIEVRLPCNRRPANWDVINDSSVPLDKHSNGHPLAGPLW